MRLVIATDEKKFFRQFLEILRSIPPLTQLRNRELDILAAMMYYNYLYKDLDDDIRGRVLNSKATKKDVREMLGMSQDVYNNNMSIIRRTGLIEKSGRLADALQVFPGATYKMEFNFNIEKDVLR